MEYLHLFNSEEEFNNARLNNYHEPWVSATLMEGLFYSLYDVTKY